MERKPVDNFLLLSEIKRLNKHITCMEEKFDKKFEEINPYIAILKDIRSAGRVAAWITGVFVGAAGAFLMFKQVITSK